MKNWFKFCLTCLGIAIALRLAFEAVTGQSVEMPRQADRRLTLSRSRLECSHTRASLNDKWQRPDPRVTACSHQAVNAAVHRD